MKLRRRSEFHQIVVRDRAGVRSLEFGDVVQSTMRIDDPSGGGLEYIDFFHMPMILRDSIRRALFIGLGAGSGPRQFLEDYPSVEIDVVEIDEEIVRLAQELFSFESSARCRIHVEDGLDFLQRSRAKWDLIIIDAYMIEKGDLVVPQELTTAAFFQLCRSRLAPQGILIFNSAAASDAPLTLEVRDSLSEVFADIVGFEAATSDNAVLLASATSLERRSTRIAEKARERLRSGTIVRKVLLRRCRQLHRGLSGSS